MVESIYLFDVRQSANNLSLSNLMIIMGVLFYSRDSLLSNLIHLVKVCKPYTKNSLPFLLRSPLSFSSSSLSVNKRLNYKYQLKMIRFTNEEKDLTTKKPYINTVISIMDRSPGIRVFRVPLLS